MIKRSTIDRVFETARVEEVIGDFLQLKKSGSSYKALSPFTDERTPSFMVSPVKQIWKDFSSGKGGNAISFLMEHEHFNYPEALRYLAKKYNIEIEETAQSDEEKKEAGERESMYLVTKFAKDYFQKQLFETETGKAIGLTYFKERGFTRETMEEFDLGYSPDVWEALTNAAREQGYKLEFLEKTGLTVVKEGKDGKKTKKFDRFKGRVMFPIHSMSGRILGFGGRILNTTKKTAKYLNSPESDIYNKSKILYGIYQAKRHIAKADNCYLVEGYTDVIQFHQSGVKNTVSSSGTSITPDQIRMVNRLTKNIVVLFDGDAAGARASIRGIDLILEQDMNVKVCALPEDEDPDSFAKTHSEDEIRTYLNDNARDFIRYKASLLMKETANDPIKKSQVIRDMMKSVAIIPNEIRQELYLKECTKIMDISEEVLYSTLAQIKAKQEADQRRREKQKKRRDFEVVKDTPETKLKVDPQYEIERQIISLLLRYGGEDGQFEDYILQADEDGGLQLKSVDQEAKVYEKILMDLQEDEIQFTNTGFQTLYNQIISEFKERQALEVKAFVNRIDTGLAKEITNILMENEQYELHRWESQGIMVKDKNELDEREVQQTILNLRMMLIKQKVKALVETMDDNRAEQHPAILEETRDYKKLQVTIANKLDSVIRADV